jgi:hypothetical protein
VLVASEAMAGLALKRLSRLLLGHRLPRTSHTGDLIDEIG